MNCQNQNKVQLNEPICRTCLSSLGENDHVSLFVGLPSLADMLYRNASVSVCEDDRLPSVICEGCASTLRSADEFLSKCRESDKRLREFERVPIKLEMDALKQLDTDKFFSSVEIYDDIDLEDIEITQSEPDFNPQPNEEGVYVCALCERKFKTLPSLVIHNRTHTGERPFKCDGCDKSFGAKSTLYEHVRRLHSDNPSSQKTFTCETCGKTFMRKVDLRVHMRVHTKERPYVCVHCGKRFAQIGTLNKHVTLHTGVRKHQCQHCDKSFNMKNRLTYHIRRLHQDLPVEKRHSCGVCDKRFISRGHVRVHMRVHTEERPYECHVCHMRFSQKASLSKHIKAHTGERPYSCNVCEKRFVGTSALNRHLSTHIIERNVKCDQCNKAFTTKSNLMSHKKYVHSGNRPHMCELCGAAFVTKTNLKVHVKAKHSEETCTVCKKEVANLSRHMKVHAPPAPQVSFPCKSCKRKFFSKKHLSMHLRKHEKAMKLAFDF